MGSIVAAESKPKNKCRKWRIFVSCGTDRKGKRIQKSKRVSGTYKQAKAELAEFEAECRNIPSEDMLLNDYMDRWLEGKKQTSTASSYANFSQVVRTLKFAFGEGVKLSDMDAELVDAVMADLLEHGGPSGRKPKPSYVGCIRKRLGTILRAARKEGYAVKDFWEDTVYISPQAPERKDIPSLEDVRNLIGSLDVRDGHQMCAYLCATLGLRRGEALGLRWQDVDLDSARASIVHALDTHGNFVAPKTPASRRELPLPDYVVAAFRKREQACREDLEVTKARGTEVPEFEDAAVCCFQDGRPMSHSAASHWWDNHRAFYGITCGLHGLRHALATNLIHSGVDPVTASKILGHASATMTMKIYTHSNLEAKENAFEVLRTAMGG